MFISGGTATSVTIDHSIIQYSESGTIDIFFDSSNTIQNSTVTNTAGQPAISIYGSTNTITNNIISATGGNSAVNVYDGSPTLTDNTISALDGYGVSIYGSSPTLIDNIITGSIYGIEISSSSPGSPVITNNTFTGNTYGLLVYGSLPAMSPTITNNTFTGNTYPIQLSGVTSGMSLTGNTGSGNTYNAIIIDGYNTQGDFTINSANDLPYVISGSFYVSPGDTLTIDPGTVVKSLDSSGLWVEGTLNAVGTPTTPVVFTSYKDDTNNGDTNADGSTTTPAAGDWGGIVILNGGTANFDYVTKQYDYGLEISDSGAELVANVTIDHSTLQYSQSDTVSIGPNSNSIIQNSTISNAAGHRAIYMYGGISTIRDNTISATGSYAMDVRDTSPRIINNMLTGSEYGLSISGSSTSSITHNTFTENTTGISAYSSASLTITNNTFSENTTGLYVNSESSTLSPTITNNTFTSNTYPIELDGVTSGMTLTGNTASDNVYDAIILSSGMYGDFTLNMTNGLPYVISDSFYVSPGDILTIDPGMVIKFLDSSSLEVYGTLNAVGTSAAPVVFTSIKDDTYGGDTNSDGSATTPAAGDWEWIQIDNGSSANLDNTVVQYAMWGAFIYNASPTITNSIITDNTYGLLVDGSSSAPTIVNNSIHDNTSYGLYGSAAITAENNWWGSATGPYNSTSNPTGTGNAVSNYVDFTPWLTADPTIDSTPPADVILGTSRNDVWNKTITLNWTNPADADFAHVRVDRTDVTAGTTTTLSSSEIGTSYVDNTASYNVNYTYSLYALDTTGNVSTGVTTATQRVRNPVPTNLTLTAGNTSITANWTASSAPATSLQGYKVYYGTSPTALTSVVTLGKVTTTTLTGLTNGTQYYVAVTAFSKTGIESQRSTTRNARPHL